MGTYRRLHTDTSADLLKWDLEGSGTAFNFIPASISAIKTICQRTGKELNLKENARRHIYNAIANDDAGHIECVPPFRDGNLVLVVYIACKRRQVPSLSDSRLRVATRDHASVKKHLHHMIPLRGAMRGL